MNKGEAWLKWFEKTTYIRNLYVEQCDARIKMTHDIIWGPYVPFKYINPFASIEKIKAEERKELDRLRKNYKDFVLGWWEKLSPDFMVEGDVIPNEVELLYKEKDLENKEEK